MNGKIVILCMAVILAVASLSEAHLHNKKFFTAPQYQEHHQERCICDCSGPQQHQPILPNKPYYGSGGYSQPRPGGYGNAGALAVAGSYGGGGSQVSGGY